MWRSRKFIIITLVAAVVLVGSIGGVVFAQTENGDTSPQARQEALLERVCEIYEGKTGTTIDPQVLKDSFAQAMGEVREAALEARLAKLVEEGVIDETQAAELQEWWESRPDVPAGFGFKVHGGFRGMGGPRGWGGPCIPIE